MHKILKRILQGLPYIIMALIMMVLIAVIFYLFYMFLTCQVGGFYET